MLKFMELGMKLKKQKNICSRLAGTIMVFLATCFARYLERCQKEKEFPLDTEKMDKELFRRIKELDDQKKKDNIE
jgi:hypothetical protein